MAYKDWNVQKEYQRLWQKKRRLSFFIDKKCVKCGSIDRLELDHIDPKTKISHCIWSWTKERRELEIAKCQVLCHKCHLLKTDEEYKSSRIHGGYYYYKKMKCKCKKCLKWHSNEVNKYRKRVKETI